MITTTLNRIREHSPCEDGWTNLLAGLGKTSADDAVLPFATILEINGLNDALWCCCAEPQYDREWRLLAVAYARRVEHLNTDPAVKNAIDVAERYSNGEATDKELAAAEAVARAARDAAWAAWAAARDTARAASAASAAEAVARVARAARDAAWAAWAAAWDTASAARAARAAEAASAASAASVALWDTASAAANAARAARAASAASAARAANAARVARAANAASAASAAWEDERKWQEQEFLRCVTETGASDGYR